MEVFLRSFMNILGCQKCPQDGSPETSMYRITSKDCSQVESCSACMRKIQRAFHARFVTVDETWIHHWDPETKQESMQWKHPCSSPLKKFKTQPSAGKALATVFWDSKGMLMVDYKPADISITGAYYAYLMKQLRTAIKKRGESWAKMSCSFMTMLLCTSRGLHKLLSGNVSLSSWIIHRTVQIWPPVITTFFEIWSHIYGETDFLTPS